MLVKGNQWKELGCKSSWMVWEKGHDWMITGEAKNELCYDLHRITKEPNESNLAMLWGSINEDSTLLIYLKRFGGKNTDNLITR